jgi:hypothetical protein
MAVAATRIRTMRVRVAICTMDETGGRLYPPSLSRLMRSVNGASISEPSLKQGRDGAVLINKATAALYDLARDAVPGSAIWRAPPPARTGDCCGHGARLDAQDRRQHGGVHSQGDGDASAGRAWLQKDGEPRVATRLRPSAGVVQLSGLRNAAGLATLVQRAGGVSAGAIHLSTVATGRIRGCRWPGPLWEDWA